MKLLLFSLALGSSIIDVVSAGCCNTCDVPYPYKPVGTCRWVFCQYGRTDITCDNGKREATEEVAVEKREGCRLDCYLDACYRICTRSTGEEEIVETRNRTDLTKRETEENCKFRSDGTVWWCPPGTPNWPPPGKREATEEVTVEKREEKKCSLNCHATDCFYLPRGCVPTEDKKREAERCHCLTRPCLCPGGIDRARRMTLNYLFTLSLMISHFAYHRLTIKPLPFPHLLYSIVCRSIHRSTMKLLLLSLAFGVAFATLLVGDGAVEKRETEENCKFRSDGTVWWCPPGTPNWPPPGKREATEEVAVEKREAEGDYSCNCNKLFINGKTQGECTECRDGRCATVSSCNKREASAQSKNSTSENICFRDRHGKIVCTRKREATEEVAVEKREAEGDYSCNCNKLIINGKLQGECTACRDGSCTTVSSCDNGKREASEEVAVEKREAEGCFCMSPPCVLPPGCPPGKREAVDRARRMTLE